MKTRKQIHFKDFDYKGSGYFYFITMCAFNKEKYFVNQEIALIIEKEIEFRIESCEINCICYCIMPNHIHLLFSFTDQYGKSLQNWISAFKRLTGRKAKEKHAIPRLWQANFYEHIVRKDESIKTIAEYILQNPVRKGLVNEWNEYKFSKLFID